MSGPPAGRRTRSVTWLLAASFCTRQSQTASAFLRDDRPTSIRPLLPRRSRICAHLRLVNDGKDINNTGISTSLSELQSILLSQSIEDISSQVSSRIVLPFYVPPPIIEAATTLAIQQISTDMSLSPELVERIGSAVALASASAATSTDSEYDGVTEAELDGIAQQLGTELNTVIDLPVLDEEQELVILKSVGRAVMVVLTSPSELIEINPKEGVNTAISTAQGLLAGREGRMKMARIMNGRVDFPLIGEEGEEELLLRALDACADRLVEALPAELIDALRGQRNSESLLKTKEFVVATINRKVNILGLTEDQEEWIIQNLVDVFIDALIGDTEAELLLMSEEEQREALVERRLILKRKMDVARRRYEAERSNLEAQVRRIDERLGQ